VEELSGAQVAFVLHHRLEQSLLIVLRGLFDDQLAVRLPTFSDELADFALQGLGIGTEGEVVTLDSHGFTDEPTPFPHCCNNKGNLLGQFLDVRNEGCSSEGVLACGFRRRLAGESVANRASTLPTGSLRWRNCRSRSAKKARCIGRLGG
jgi:hypothetical protein